MTDEILVGSDLTYYGYPIDREGEDEYRVSIYADTLQDAKAVIKKCMEAGIIERPSQVRGRRKEED